MICCMISTCTTCICCTCTTYNCAIAFIGIYPCSTNDTWGFCSCRVTTTICISSLLRSVGSLGSLRLHRCLGSVGSLGSVRLHRSLGSMGSLGSLRLHRSGDNLPY